MKSLPVTLFLYFLVLFNFRQTGTADVLGQDIQNAHEQIYSMSNETATAYDD